MIDKTNIDILLATFNGAEFLNAQLESICNQSIQNWRLIVRDDGSTDATMQILQDWARRTSANVLVLKSEELNLGATQNFGLLLETSDAPYFCFCDQDDIWLPDKLEQLWAAVLRAESLANSDIPCLAHSDLTVVSAERALINSSLWRMLKVEPGKGSRHGLLFQNYVTGCAMIGNAALRSKMGAIPASGVRHDYWAALVAHYLGKTEHLTKPTIEYRQHGQNVIGATQWSTFQLTRRLFKNPLKQLARARNVCDEAQLRARALIEGFGEKIDENDLKTLTELAEISKQPSLYRKRFIYQRGATTGYWLRDAIFSLFL